jgi:uncharacterized protein YqkB
METLYPLCFHEGLSEEQAFIQECSDGIYVSSDRFRTFMDSNDSDCVILTIKRGGKSITSHIVGTHSDTNETVYAPLWICELLGATGGEVVELQRVYPLAGNTITIKPHTSHYTLLDDPATELRNAFERYSCINSGIDIPLLVNGEVLTVSIIDNEYGEPVCIRGIELSLEIATPLDKEAEIEAAQQAKLLVEKTRLDTEKKTCESNQISDATVGNTVTGAPSITDYNAGILPPSMLAMLSNNNYSVNNPFKGVGHRLN